MYGGMQQFTITARLREGVKSLIQQPKVDSNHITRVGHSGHNDGPRIVIDNPGKLKTLS